MPQNHNCHDIQCASLLEARKKNTKLLGSKKEKKRDLRGFERKLDISLHLPLARCVAHGTSSVPIRVISLGADACHSLAPLTCRGKSSKRYLPLNQNENFP